MVSWLDFQDGEVVVRGLELPLTCAASVLAEGLQRRGVSAVVLERRSTSLEIYGSGRRIGSAELGA
jgi:hypothetical protein